MSPGERKVILASSLGTVFEWYDFFLYGSLATIIGAQFFSAYPEATRNIFALLAFAAGFIVRPFGALVFGRLGDMVGRKHTFLVTILIMGLSTFCVGLLPSYDTLNGYGIGWAAPVTLLALRMLQGLALGGEYGGAAVYVAEHAPRGRRGFYTSFIQATATLGLLLSLVIILSTQSYVNSVYPGGTATNADGTTNPVTAFQVWGWRVPFLVSIVLLGVSVWIRLQMNESPAFQKMKDEGTRSKAPLSEAFGQWRNAKWALLALFGLTAGQAVVWYTGQFYCLFFLQSILKVDQFTANVMVAWSLIAVTGGFLFFGALSDRIGRKPVILGGCLLAALSYFPLFEQLTANANPALHRAQATVPVVVKTDPAGCSFQFNPVGTAKFTRECDVAKALLARSAVRYRTESQPAGTPTVVTVSGQDFAVADPNFAKAVSAALAASGYPSTAANPTVIKAESPIDIFSRQKLTVIAILFAIAIFVTMAYGPIAAALVELFPTRIRYTAMSLPYHIGNGWFGGLLPATAFAMVAQTGDIYYGLWYPIVVSLVTVVIGLLFVPETKDRDILT
ncbi:MFS transporter [Methylobacterium sp. E-045]|uniref:MFS transporter n=1 Tax=Methylobacterium sp. E-045 TaxID=2836575 RepID=UPI001FB9A8A8|nr:MFS transporter [Methylobacterium sp. E-045]MCJ2130763.1 MFS transporter [Methylobacterium sp. E-045]